MTSDREQQRERWQASGLSRAAYCRQQGIAYHMSRSWTKPPRTTAVHTESSAFVEILRRPTDIREHHVGPAAAICLPSGVVLRVDVGTDPGWIGRVLTAVQPC